MRIHPTYQEEAGVLSVELPSSIVKWLTAPVADQPYGVAKLIRWQGFVWLATTDSYQLKAIKLCRERLSATQIPIRRWAHDLHYFSGRTLRLTFLTHERVQSAEEKIQDDPEMAKAISGLSGTTIRVGDGQEMSPSEFAEKFSRSLQIVDPETGEAIPAIKAESLDKEGQPTTLEWFDTPLDDRDLSKPIPSKVTSDFIGGGVNAEFMADLLAGLDDTVHIANNDESKSIWCVTPTAVTFLEDADWFGILAVPQPSLPMESDAA